MYIILHVMYELVHVPIPCTLYTMYWADWQQPDSEDYWERKESLGIPSHDCPGQ